MTHEEAFLQAIREAPDDDAPRLLYADWLEERGDPRGAFIRVQCALEQRDPADPARPELEDEAQALLDKHEAEWTAPFRRAASEWRFRRGFVEEVTTTADAFLSGGGVFGAFPIRKVRLCFMRDLMRAVANCPHLARVRVLDVSGLHLRDHAVEALLASPHLTRLTGLNFGGNAIEGPAVRALVESPLMPRLTWLNLSNNHSLGLRAVRALASAPAPALRFLGLSHTNIGPSGLRDLLSSTTLIGLTSLQAAYIGLYGVAGAPAAEWIGGPLLSRLTCLDLNGFARVGRLPALLGSSALGRITSLGLADCRLGAAGAGALAESPHLTGLTSLDLGRNGIGPEGLQALATSPRLSGLTDLRLGDNALRDKGAQALAESPHLKRLTALDLHKNGVGGPGLLALAASPNLDGLTTLDLSDNYVGLESVKALVASPYLARLTSLCLNNNRLEPAAARALAASPHLNRLSTLHLDGNDLGDEGLRALLCSPYLTRLAELSVRTNGVGKAGADALAALLADSPRWGRLSKLDLRGNPLSGPEQRVLEQRFGARVEL